MEQEKRPEVAFAHDLHPPQLDPTCTFCRILRGEVGADRVLEDAATLAFLDRRPLFPGHVLLIPRHHVPTLVDLPREWIEPLFSRARLLARALEEALKAEGTFVAINNRVSQSVPHLHIHIVPRRRGDGLRGFFWPRHPYPNDQARQETARKIREAVERLRGF